jgi:transposase
LIRCTGAFSCTPARPSAPPTSSPCSTNSAAYGTSERARPLVAVLDNGPIHRSKLTTRALAQRPWLTLEWLPKYAPELNDIERCWRDLKQHQLANRTFADADALACAIPDAVARLNHERQPHSSPLLIRSA